MRLVVSFAHIHDDDSFVDVDLGRGQANARRRVHGFQHVLSKDGKVCVEGLYRCRLGAQARIRVVKYFQSSHMLLSF